MTVPPHRTSPELDSVTKAAVLLEALPYIQRFKNACFVIKYGGSFIEHPNPKVCERVAYDIVLLAAVGIRIVIVHGGGKAITRAFKNTTPQFIDGLRVTDEATMAIVEKTLNLEVNPKICSMIQSSGGQPISLHGNRLFRCQKLHHKSTNGQNRDLGYVGKITHVDTATLKELLDSDVIPVVSPIALDDTGTPFNTNADAAAAAVAAALRARRLFYLCDVPGLLKDTADPDSLISTLRLSDVEGLKKTCVISQGMQPKVDSAVDALRGGVHRVHLIDGQADHSLLLEIFTDKGIGTEIVH